MNKEIKKMQDQLGQVMVGREKNWAEIDADQRIQRLKEVVSGLEHTIEYQRDIIAKLKNHQHLPTGEIVGELFSDRDMGHLNPGRSFSRLD